MRHCNGRSGPGNTMPDECTTGEFHGVMILLYMVIGVHGSLYGYFRGSDGSGIGKAGDLGAGGTGSVLPTPVRSIG